MVVALVIIFVWVLPQVIDYDEVWQALTQLDPPELAVLLVIALARVPSEALMYRAFLPGLSLWRGSLAFLSSNFAGQLLPPPTASLVQYRCFRAEGYTTDSSRLAAIGSFLFPMMGRFLLPPVALMVLVVSGEVDGRIIIAAALALLITALLSLAAYFLLRTDQSARKLGVRAERPLAWLGRRRHRDATQNVPQRAVELRHQALAILQEGWRRGTTGVALNLLTTYLLLYACLRYLGVSTSTLSAAEAFAAFAIAFWAGAVFPITGSGLGVVDTVLIVALAELSSADDDALIASVLLWRVYYSAVILPIGAITMSRIRSPEQA